jgi:hypothetical protein
MIIRILDFETSEKAIVIFTNENDNYLEFHLEGDFEIKKEDNFHEGTRITIGKYDCEILIGLLQKWVDNKNKTEC